MDSLKNKIDNIYERLIFEGYAKFDVPKDWLKNVSQSELVDLSDGFYGDYASHIKYFEESEFFSELENKIRLENSKLGGDFNRQFVVRVVESGSSEKYRTHYDSHRFTIVIPLVLPEQPSKDDLNGQLYMVPNHRNNPRSEIGNLFGKVLGLRYRAEKNYPSVTKLNNYVEPKFKVGEALIFAGNVCLHGNKENLSKEKRITLITHYCDPFKFGVGAMLRKVRYGLNLRK